MKNAIIILNIMFCFMACKNVDDAFTSYGPETTEVRHVGDFTKIMAGEKFDVVLIQDSINAGRIEVTAGEHVISGYTSTVHNGELRIVNENKFNWVRKLKIRQKVLVYFKTLNQIQINGSAKFTCQDSIVNNNTITILHGGIEDADLKIKSDYIFIHNTNTGGVNLKGNCFLVSISVDDISFVNALELNAEKCYISSFSRDDSYVNAKKVLEIRLFGTGNIFYTRVPDDVFSIEDTGEGEVLKY